MTPLEQLKSIYEDYETKLSKAVANASAFAGVFGMGDDPRKDACNQIFYESLEAWAGEYAQSTPSAGEAAEAVRWIVEYPAENRRANTYWYAYAAQKHAICLVPFLSPADAAQIRQTLEDSFERTERLPVQQELIRALKKQAGASNASGAAQKSMLQIWGPRVVLLLVGLTIAHLGVTLFLLANLGSDPFNVLIQGLHRMIPWPEGLAVTHGNVHVVMSLLIILALLATDRSYVRIGTFLCMILGGPIIDLFTLLLQGILNESSPMAVRIVGVILGCGILAFGMTIVIKSQAGTGPNDLVAVATSDKMHWKFGIVRVAVDLCFALIGFLLGGVVGLGTIICMAVVGPVAQIFMPISEKICGKFLVPAAE